MTKSRTKLIKEAHELLDEFLNNYCKSDGGGYAPFTTEDQATLVELLRKIREVKFEVDSDGDLPLEFKIINRTKSEPMHFFVLPYLHQQDRKGIIEYLTLANTNMQIAADIVRHATHAMQEEFSEG